MSAPEITVADLAQRLDAVLARVDSPAPRFLTVDGAADYCSLSAESIRRLLSNGKLQPHRPVKGRILIDRVELETLVLTSTQRPL